MPDIKLTPEVNHLVAHSGQALHSLVDAALRTANLHQHACLQWAYKRQVPA